MHLASEPLIVALDVPSARDAHALAESVRSATPWVKVGLELFVAEGPPLVRELRAKGHRIMLDLKLHDIPKTVARAMTRVADLGVELCTVHAAGGAQMLEAAVGAAPELKVLAVTVLTSLEGADLEAIGVHEPVADAVKRRASLARECGVGGVVCSPLEASAVRALVPQGLIVTPGVRPAGAALGDQKRVTTPAQARDAGVSFIVVGRPIRDADDPGAAARSIRDELMA